MRVQPRAGRSALGEPLGEDALKVWLRAAPVEGEANAELIRLLADSFGVPRGAVTLTSGQRGRTKQVRIRAPTRLPLPLPRI